MPPLGQGRIAGRSVQVRFGHAEAWRQPVDFLLVEFQMAKIAVEELLGANGKVRRRVFLRVASEKERTAHVDRERTAFALRVLPFVDFHREQRTVETNLNAMPDAVAQAILGEIRSHAERLAANDGTSDELDEGRDGAKDESPRRTCRFWISTVKLDSGRGSSIQRRRPSAVHVCIWKVILNESFILKLGSRGETRSTGTAAVRLFLPNSAYERPSN